MRLNVYLPDDLGARVKAELGDANLSAIFQEALIAELDRAQARTGLGDYDRVKIYDSERGREVAFQGKFLGTDDRTDLSAWLTPKDAIAVNYTRGDNLWIYANYAEFSNALCESAPRFVAEVASSLGEEYVEELDI
jgi:hypothetical protein